MKMPDTLQISNDISEMYVGNFPFNYTTDDVKKFFAGYDVQRVRWMKNKDNVYAFVKFSSGEEAMEALDEYKNITLGGRKLMMSCAQRDRHCGQNGAHPSNGINGDESDVEESTGPPPLVPIPQHILRKMTADRNAALLAEKKSREELMTKGIADGKWSEPIAKVIICNSSQGPTEEYTAQSKGINDGYEGDESEDSDGPPPLVPIPQNILRMMIQSKNAELLQENKSVETIKSTINDAEKKEVQKRPPLLPTPETKDIVKEVVTVEEMTDKKTSTPHSTAESSAMCERVAKVIICDFPPRTTEVELLELFERYCPVKCMMMANSPDNSMEGFTYAFIFLPNGRFASLAASNLNGTVFKGNKISVKHVVLPSA